MPVCHMSVTLDSPPMSSRRCAVAVPAAQPRFGGTRSRYDCGTIYFSHNFKTGDSIELAHQVRRRLDLMDLKFM